MGEAPGPSSVATGDGGRARELFQRSLDLREQLAAREPDNTGYQRDVSVSLERLGGLALEDGDRGTALVHLSVAVENRRRLADREPERLDLAEEFGVAAYLLAQASGEARSASLKAEVKTVLEGVEQRIGLTPKGRSVLDWATEPT